MAQHQSLYRIVYQDAGWTVTDHDGRRVGAQSLTQGDAVVRAKEARHDGAAQIVVQDRDGKVVSDFMYQREERPSLKDDDVGDDSMFASHATTRGSRSSVDRTSRPSNA